MKIRKYQETDKENLRKICIATATPQKNERGEKLLTLLYNDYYTEHEPENCFVLADDGDKAVGYIICSENFFHYKKIFMAEYMPQIKKLNFTQYFAKLISLYFVEPKLSREYPAHLHIDILHDYTGKGSGSGLVETLFSHLSAKKIKGIMLGVGCENDKAIKFYLKHGLIKLKTIPHICVLMGKKF